MKTFNGREVDIPDTTFVYVETARLISNRIIVMWAITLIIWIWLRK